MVQLNEIEQMLQDGVGLVLCDAHDAARKVGVDKDRLPACDRVRSAALSAQMVYGSCRLIYRPDDRMDSLQVSPNVPR